MREALGNAPSEALAGPSTVLLHSFPGTHVAALTSAAALMHRPQPGTESQTKFHVPPNSCAKALTPNAVVLGGGALGESLCLGEVMR